ncbi:MAG: CHASE domain-containing protein [Magnetococcales bacterium]|nr:CHASE domain-containing protein [Magnetococcales bacterium]
MYHIDAQGNPFGFAIDVLTEVARRASWHVHYLVVENWEEAAGALRDKRADIIPNMGLSDAMAREFLFSDVLELLPVSCFVRHDNQETRDCAHLEGRRVGVVRQGAAFQKLHRQPGVNLIPTHNLENALFQLVNGTVDLLIAPQPVVTHKAESMGMRQAIKPVGHPFMELKRGMVVGRENAPLLSEINAALQDITRSTQYREKFQFWYGRQSQPPRENAPSWWLVATLLAVGGGILSLWRARARISVISPLQLLHHRVTGWIILATSVVLTILAWHFSNLYAEKRSQDRFDFRVEEARLAIQKRMREYEQVLRGGVGLFNASDEVTRSGWHNYVTTLQIDTYWPGIQGIGFARMIPPDEKEAFTERIRKEGFDAFSIHPEGERSQYSAIIYLEPFIGRNLRAFGYDMFSEKVRRAAMEQARDSGVPTLSGRVTLVQETHQDVQTGFLMYLPVYRSGLPIATIQERRDALIGFVYSPFRIRDLMEGILGHGVPNLDFAIFDGTESSREQLLHSTQDATRQPPRSTPPRHTNTSLLDLPGRTWHVHFASHPSFEQEMESNQPLIVALLGMMVDLLLFVIVLSLSGQKERIQLQAREIAKELNKADVRYRRMVENIKDVIFQLDLQGNWRFLNPAWEEVSGHTVQDSLGSHFIDYLHPDDRTRAGERFRQLIDGTQTSLRDAFNGLHHSGRPVWVEVYAVLQSDEEGRTLGVSGTLRDITLQKQIETVMVQARDAAESANRAKSEFLANMSHELRTPLNSLLILSRLLGNAENLTAEQRESARVIHESGTDLLHMINDILDLSKVEAGRMELRLEPLSLPRLLEGLRSQFAPVARNKGLTLETELAPDLPHALTTDEARLEQILRNLIANALKFTDSGGVRVRVFRQSEWIAFGVADTGIGIPVDKLELIFETFRQGDGATSRKYGGTGLGLSISRKFARLLQGTIQVESQEDRGSTFTLLLPEHASVVPSDRETEPPPPVAFHAPWATVLVVDDDAHNRFALKTMLADRVKTVLVAANGTEALRHLHANPSIDMVLMDIMMPVMDGFQAIQAIRLLPVGIALPIVALTAKAMAGDRERCLEVGANDYIVKPIRVEHLFMTLQQWLQPQQKPAAPIAPVSGAPSDATRETTTPLMVNGHPATLLVAEDDMRTAYSVAKGLQTRVENVLLASNGLKALKTLETHPEVDAILMDMRMPDMDGYETIRRIRTDPRFRHLPILALTALAMPEDQEKCLAAGADDCLAKPVEMATLWQALERCLLSGSPGKPEG